MRRMPYGIMNFKTLIEEDYYYVDKTMYLEKLEKMPDALINLRPGRFGKSLFTSMMYYYYDINSTDLFEELFKETYVYQNPTKEKNSYYILKFDFSGIDSAGKGTKDLEIEFKSCVINGIINFLNKYDFAYEIEKDKSIPIILKNFLTFFRGLKLKNNIYVLIDEYDNFTNAILEGDTKRFKRIVGNEGFVKAFYAAIKENMGTIIGRFFATGICPITLDSMTTGFNIATDISTDIRVNSMIGLTHKEVKDLLKKTVEEKDREEIYNLMVNNYDGYLFNKNADERVFNATLVMYLLNYYEAFKKIPEELMDKNIVSNYGKIGKLLKLKENDYYNEIIDELLKNDEITGELQNNFNLELDISKNDLISLLYYFGYLTIGENSFMGIKFKVPNKVMKEAYNNYFIKILNEINIKINNDKMNEIFSEVILNGKIEKLSNYVSELLKASGNRIFIKFDEKYIQLMYYTLLRHPQINIKLEYPCKDGYAGIVLMNGKNKLMKNNIIIELKYIEKQDYNEKLLNEKIREGKIELKKYSKDKKISNTLKYLVVFIGNDLKIIEEV